MRPTKNSGCWSPLPTVNSASFFPEFRIIANSDQQKENDDQQETTAHKNDKISSKESLKTDSSKILTNS